MRLLFEQKHPDQKSKAPQLFGQELNPVTFAIAKMNMFLHDSPSSAELGQAVPELEEQFKLLTHGFRIISITDVVGMSFEEFAADTETLDAVIRNLTIIGKAARNVPVEIQECYRDVPWREMQGMRNVVVHEYHGVSALIIWRTATANLPPVVEMLNAILRQEP